MTPDQSSSILFAKNASGTNSYDVHLGRYISVYRDKELDARKHNTIIESEIGPEGFLMRPGMIYLGVTEEYTETHHTVPFLEVNPVSEG